MRTLAFCLIALLFFSTNLSAQAIESPVDYMTAIENAHVEMNQRYMAYLSASSHGKRARKVEKLRIQALESITKSRYKTIEIPFYKGDNSLRQSSIDYIQMCYNVFNDDYARIVNMEDIAEQSFDDMQAYILLKQKENGISKKLVGFKMIDRGIPRSHYLIKDADNNEIGHVTSGTQSPTLGYGIGLGYIDLAHSKVGTEIFIEVRNKLIKAVVTKIPFL